MNGKVCMQVSPEGPAFEVQVDGFSHKLPVLVESIFTKLADFRVSRFISILADVCMCLFHPVAFMPK